MNPKVAIITGAGRGIGRATAAELSRLGFRTVLVGRNDDILHDAQRAIPHSAVHRANVTNVNDINAVVQHTLQHFGRIDALVNNAGVAPVLSVEETSPEAWREVVEINLSAAFYLSRAVWPTFKQQKSGVIVNISSRAARDPFDGFAAYGAAKAGLNTLGISLAREGAPLGIRVHTIAPGAVETEMFRNILSHEQFPSENTLDPAEVAVVVGQCITGALAHTSGEVIWLSKRP